MPYHEYAPLVVFSGVCHYPPMSFALMRDGGSFG